jgi:hypothetical protein
MITPVKLRSKASQSFICNVNKLYKVKKYLSLYEKSSDYFYEDNLILNDVISIDINSFNMNFLKLCNLVLKENNLDLYINYCSSLSKKERVVEFGLFYKDVSDNGIILSEYMISVRNFLFNKFLNLLNSNSRSLSLKRINFDDVEFIYSDNEVNLNDFIIDKYLHIAKINIYDYVIVLNKVNGIFYVKDGNVVDIKYTSGWVNIPAYFYLLTYVIKYIIGEVKTLNELNKLIMEYVKYADNSDFFGYDDDELSKSFNPNDFVYDNVKYLFVANVMSKFSNLI